jgi:hypothetical protein
VEEAFYRRKMTSAMKPVLTVKWSDPVLDEGYVAFPKRLVRAAPKIFRGEHAMEQMAVALALVDYIRPDNSRPPSVGFLAFTAGLDAERFQDRLRELADLGLVTWMGNREGLKYSLEGLQQAILENSGED